MSNLKNLAPWVLIAAAVVAISGFHDQVLYSLASLTMLIVLCAWTFPAARFLFGSGITPLIFAVPVGCILNSLGLSLAAWAGGFRPVTLLIYAALATLLSILLWRKVRASNSEPILPLESADRAILLTWMVIVTAAVAPAFLKVGIETPEGFAYRAYFNTDVFRNMATAGSLMRSGIPPENPYFSGYPLHYYWLFHVIPAFWMTILPGYRVDFLFVQFALVTALAFSAALWAVARSISGRPRTVLYLLPLYLVGGSYEGLYVLNNLNDRKMAWTQFTTQNIDGILRWVEKLPQVDTLYRPLLYAPQHLMAVIVFLMLVLLWRRLTRNSQRLLLLGIVFAAVGYSVIVGAILVLSTGVLMLADALGKRKGVWVEMAAGAALGLLFLALFLKGFAMFDLGHGDLKPVMPWALLSKLPKFFLLQWGAILFFGLAGLLFWKQKDVTYLAVCVFLALSTFFVVFVQIDVPGLSDISLKSGYVCHVAMLLLSARFIDQAQQASPGRRRLLAISMIASILPASITWGLDAYNCQDIQNPRFTTKIAKPQMELYMRMRTVVEPQARVQDYFAARSSFIESYVSETPPFANRSLYVGDAILSRIFQTPKDELKKRRDLAETFSESEDPRILAHLSHRAGIEYVVAYPHEPNPFDASGASRYFEPVTRVDNWGLYRVMTKESPLFYDRGDYLWYDEEPGTASLTTLYEKGFHPVELLGDDEPARWMSRDAVIRFDSAREFRGTLIFLAHSYARARTMELSWNGEPAVIWQFGRATKKVSLPVVIPAGRSELRLHCVEGPDKGPGPDQRQLSFKIWAMQFVPQE